MEIKFYDLFPTTIWVADLSVLSGNFAKWLDQIHLLKNSSTEMRGNSNRLGWNSHATLATNPEFRELFEEIGSILKSCLNETSLKECKFSIEAWVNMHYRGGYNNLHVHPNSLLSACFYLSVPPGSGALVFRDPSVGAMMSPFQGQGKNSKHEQILMPSNGILVVFPSWLDHKVEPHESDEPRVSIAVNAILRT